MRTLSPKKLIGLRLHSWSGHFQAQNQTPDIPSIVLVAQSCPALCNPMDCSPPDSSVHGDSPGKNAGVGAHALLRGSSQPKDQTWVSCTAGRFFTIRATWYQNILPTLWPLHHPTPFFFCIWMYLFYTVFIVNKCIYLFYTVFKGEFPFTVIVEFWLYSLCHTVYPCSLLYT